MWTESNGEYTKNYEGGKYAIVYQLPNQQWSWEVNDGSVAVCQGTALLLLLAQTLCDTCALTNP